MFRIFLCDANTGFDYDEAEKMGYNGYGDFLNGKIKNKSDIMSWVGASNNPWPEVKKKLFFDPIKDFKNYNTFQTRETRMFPLRS